MWESYEIHFGPCSDLELKITNQNLTEVAGELRAVYRIAVIPTALKVRCTPTILISDEKGQTTVLNGKPVTVHEISGDSEEIKEPPLPGLPNISHSSHVLLYLSLIVLLVLSGILTARRLYSKTPRQRFLRDLRKASLEAKSKRLPIQVWRLLRSEMVWGFSAEALTPSQLSEKAIQNRKLLTIASALQSLERWRYSGSHSDWDNQLVVQALGYAAELTNQKRRRGRAA